MLAFLRALPNALWWATLGLAILAIFTQIAIAVARSGAVALWMLLLELVVTVGLLSLPVGIAWYGRQKRSIWYTAGALVLLLAMGRIFFF